MADLGLSYNQEQVLQGTSPLLWGMNFRTFLKVNHQIFLSCSPSDINTAIQAHRRSKFGSCYRNSVFGAVNHKPQIHWGQNFAVVFKPALQHELSVWFRWGFVSHVPAPVVQDRACTLPCTFWVLQKLFWLPNLTALLSSRKRGDSRPFIWYGRLLSGHSTSG